MQVASIEPAVPLEQDPSQHLALLADIHAAVAQSSPTPAHPRHVVDLSWQRMLKNRLSVDLDIPSTDAEGVDRAIESIRQTSDIDLLQIDRYISAQLNPVLLGTKLVGILTTPDARVIQRYGDAISLGRADRLGFVRGARWGENVVGTNAIGTAAVSRHAVQIHGPEHWCLNQHRWSCSAAPILDPRTGNPLGILDISGPVSQAHPALLGMVTALAQQIELHLRESHLAQLERVRSAGWGVTRALGTPWILVDRYGWVAAASGLHPHTRLTHEKLVPGIMFLDGVGAVEVTRLDTGYLVQPLPTAEHAIYRLKGTCLEITIAGDRNSLKISPKHRAIIELLVGSSRPLTLEEITSAIWGSTHDTKVSTARAEMSRLRKRFPELISVAPYHLLQPVEL